MAKLFLGRHGQSQYNLENRFTGWVDVPLTDQGKNEASALGKKLLQLGAKPQFAYTSGLIRAQDTLRIALQELHLSKAPTIVADQALNERHYGELQGKNKKETAEQFGDAQVLIWRRSYDVAPPGGESLKDTAQRTIPYFRSVILPQLQQGKECLVIAHGNSLRSIIMNLEQMSPEQILKTELSTGELWVYEVDPNGNSRRL